MKTFFSSFLLYSSFLSLVILIDAFPVWLYNTGNSKKALTKKCKLCNFQTVILQLYKNWLNQGYFFKILIVQKFQTAVENLISNLNISCGTYEMNCFLNQKQHLQGKSLFYVFVKKDLWWRSCLLNLLAQNLWFIWIGATLQMLYRKICKFFKKRYFLLFFFGETYLSGEKCRVNLFFYLYLFFDAICTV